MIRVMLDGMRLGNASRRMVWDAEIDAPAIVLSTWRVNRGAQISLVREGANAGSSTVARRTYEPGEPVPINPVPR